MANRKNTGNPPGEDSPLQFPCDFTIKVFGLASEVFEMEVITVIRQHVPDLRENALALRYSRDRKYLALSVTFTAESREQLDSLYRDLSGNPHVLMTL